MNRPLMLFALLALSGCWSRTQVMQPKPAELSNAVYTVRSVSDSTGQVPAALMADMKTYLVRVLTEAGSYSERPGDGIHEVSVEVKRYQMRKSIWRLLFGAWSGRDSIESRVVVKNVAGETAAEAVISTFNQTAGGGGEYMVPANVRDIARYLAGSKVRK